MQKIPTIFKRDASRNGQISTEYAIDTEKFLIAEATEKIDGMNVRVTTRNHIAVRLEKRRNPDKIQKYKGVIEPWYIDTAICAEDKWLNDKWLGRALIRLDLVKQRKRMNSGQFVILNISKAKEKLKIFKEVC